MTTSSGQIASGVGSLKKITTRGTLTTKFAVIRGVSRSENLSTSRYGTFKPAKASTQAGIVLKGVNYNMISITCSSFAQFGISLAPQFAAGDNIFVSVTISRLDGGVMYSSGGSDVRVLTLNEADISSFTQVAASGSQPKSTLIVWNAQQIGLVGNSDGDEMVYKFNV